MTDPWHVDNAAPPDDPFGRPSDDDLFATPAQQPDGADGPDEVTRLQERLTSLEAAVADIVDAMNLAPDGPWVWHRLDDAARRKLAGDLVAWVEWLSSRYLAHMSQDNLKLPPDWYTNPVVVELFTALYVGYLSVYSSQRRVPSMALIEWHERGLWPTLERLKSLKLIHHTQGVYSTAYTVTTASEAVDVLAASPPDDPRGETT